MGQILVRELGDDIIAALKREASASNRSLEAQVRTVLASWVRMGRFRDFLSQTDASPASAPQTAASSAEIVRASRDGR